MSFLRVCTALVGLIAAGLLAACGGDDGSAGQPFKPASAEEVAGYLADVQPLLAAGYCPEATNRTEVIFGSHLACTPSTFITLYETEAEVHRYVRQLASGYCSVDAESGGSRKYAVTERHLVIDGPDFVVDTYAKLIGAVPSAVCP